MDAASSMHVEVLGQQKFPGSFVLLHWEYVGSGHVFWRENISAPLRASLGIARSIAVKSSSVVPIRPFIFPFLQHRGFSLFIYVFDIDIVRSQVSRICDSRMKSR